MVAAVNGIAFGGGLLIAMLSDVAVVRRKRATFRAPELLLGIAGTGYAAYLPPHIGLARARDLLFTGRRVAAPEALAIGLVARVVSHDRLLDGGPRRSPRASCRTGPDARLHVKRILNGGYGNVDRMTFEASVFGPEAREGMRAFAEKRSPGGSRRRSTPESGSRIQNGSMERSSRDELAEAGRAARAYEDQGFDGVLSFEGDARSLRPARARGGRDRAHRAHDGHRDRLRPESDGVRLSRERPAARVARAASSSASARRSGRTSRALQRDVVASKRAHARVRARAPRDLGSVVAGRRGSTSAANSTGTP